MREEHGQHRPVALAFERSGRRGLQQKQRLVVPECWRRPLAVHRGWAPDAQRRVMQHGTAVAEIITMRFMVIVKADKDTEAGVMPSEKLLRQMVNYNQQLVKAGVMLAGEGLQPSSKGAR